MVTSTRPCSWHFSRQGPPCTRPYVQERGPNDLTCVSAFHQNYGASQQALGAELQHLGLALLGGVLWLDPAEPHFLRDRSQSIIDLKELRHFGLRRRHIEGCPHGRVERRIAILDCGQRPGRGADRHAALSLVDQLLLDLLADEPLEEEEGRLGVLAGPADDRKRGLRVGGPLGLVTGLGGRMGSLTVPSTRRVEPLVLAGS